VVSSAQLVIKLARWLNNEKPDILHTWLTPANTIGRLATRLSWRPILINSLRVVEGEKKLHIFLEKLLHRITDAVTVNCMAVRRFAVESLRIPESKLHLIPNGIDETSQKGNGLPQQIPASWVHSQNNFLIGSAGRLETQKGFPHLLEAFHELLKIHPQARLLVAGEGSQRKNLVKKLLMLNIQDKVRLIGPLQNLTDFLRSLHVFVLPSLWEGFPNVLMEAMLMKIPILATSVGGVNELVIPGRTGYLVAPADSRALANALFHILSSPEEAQQQAERGHSFLRDNFPLSQTVHLTQSLYEKLLDERRRTPLQ
jgi:glycosyltransferase involved in cell wall biosynthesis